MIMRFRPAKYQLDQSSPNPASAAADLVLEKQRPKQPREISASWQVTPYHWRLGDYTLGTLEAM